MSKNEGNGASKKLSWLLRHGAGEAGLEMDAAGWAEVADVRRVEGIAREGILPGERTHVHLAEATDSTVGKRAAVDVMLAVAPSRLRELGIGLHRSPNGVLLAREVPPATIVGLVPVVDRARRQEPHLRGLFGWDPTGAERNAPLAREGLPETG
jgi:RNA:NAD 2'-phosphotransferase (TPT1/KptA family)